jgi:hypothetical protein
MSRRPPRPAPRCIECNIITAAADGRCPDCKAGRDPIALPDGRWVPNGRGTVEYRVSATGLRVERGAA